MPQSVQKELDSAMKNFWWGFPPDKTNNLTLKAWHQICTPNFMGGLGLRMINDVNMALVAKLAGQVVTQSDCLWVNLLRAKYIKQGDMWSLSTCSNQSWIWKWILRVREGLKAGYCYSVGNGINISVWRQPWIPSLPNFQPTPNASALPLDGDLMVSALILSD